MVSDAEMKLFIPILFIIVFMAIVYAIVNICKETKMVKLEYTDKELESIKWAKECINGGRRGKGEVSHLNNLLGLIYKQDDIIYELSKDKD